MYCAKFSLFADSDLLPSLGRSKFACLWLLFSLMIFLCLFFCLCCYSLLYGLQVPALPTPACVDFCCLRPRAYKNLTTASSICNYSLPTNFRSQFKMVFVHTISHHELALVWSVCCLPLSLPLLAQHLFSVPLCNFSRIGVSLLFCMYWLVFLCLGTFQFLGKCSFSFLGALNFSHKFLFLCKHKLCNLFELAMSSMHVKY